MSIQSFFARLRCWYKEMGHLDGIFQPENLGWKRTEKECELHCRNAQGPDTNCLNLNSRGDLGLCYVLCTWTAQLLLWSDDWMPSLTGLLSGLCPSPSLCTQCHGTAALAPLPPDSGQPSDARPGPSEKASSWATHTSKAPGLSIIISLLTSSGYK